MIESRYLRMSDACRIYSLSPKTIRRMMDDGDIDGDRTPGGHRRILKSSLDEWFTRGDKMALAITKRLGL